MSHEMEILSPQEKASSERIIPARPLPLTPCPSLSIRVATLADLPFIDRLQKLHARQVGFMPRQSLEQKIARGHVLIADSIAPRRHGGTEDSVLGFSPNSSSVSQ